VKKNFLFRLSAIAMSLILVACGGSTSEDVVENETTAIESEESLNVVVTTPMLGEFVKQVAGDSVVLDILMPAEADPHTYDPSPQDAAKIADADIVLYVGIKYETSSLLKLIENTASTNATLLEIGEEIDPIEFKDGEHDHGNHDDHDEEGHDDDKDHDHDDEDGHDDHDEEGHDDEDGHDDHDEDGHDDHDEEGHDDDKDHDHDDEDGHDDHDEEGHEGHEGHDHGSEDPHFWFDPVRVAMAVEVIKDSLVSLDPANTSTYEANADNFISELTDLDAQVKALIESVSEDNRKIVTTHEALGYLEARYGIEVFATIIPSLSTADEISPSQIADVIDVIEDNNIKVLFVESEAPSVYAETVAAEAGITAVTGLYVETLKDGQTYSDFLISNVTLIVESLNSAGEG
jgi:ABC-type Zn uptake system ZnuABC Zn-binding protein ZnuA